MTWPPTLDELKTDRDIALSDSDEDERLQQVLDAAVEFVQRVRGRDFNFDGDIGSTKPDPGEAGDLILGTLRLAGRWHTRRRSPDGLIDMGDLGSSRVSSFDPDIDRLLRVGRHARGGVG